MVHDMFRKATVFRIVVLATVFGLFQISSAMGQKPCGPPPKAERHRIKAGEGFPPLPLPVTPLRRTEKKRPPSPPVLMGKINYGEPMIGVRPDGSSYQYWNWTNVPGDTKGLFRVAQKALGINYKAQVVRLNGFSFRPEEVPIMYFTGFEKISFSPGEREKIRRFVLQGGFIFGDSCCGTGPFDSSFREEIQAIFPDRPWHRFPPDHPLYSCFNPVDKVDYFDDNKPGKTQIVLEGINVGCRAAVIFSPYDLSCGWGGEIYPEGRHVAIHDARKMGVNLVAYCLAWYRLGRDLSITRVFREDTLMTGDIVIGQIMHEGDWDPSPHAVPHLMRFVSENTTGNVVYRVKPIRLADDELGEYPFLYLTGHLDFHFSRIEREKLRSYLQNGGFLFINSCCNRARFDQAVRRELEETLPETSFHLLEKNHPIYRGPFHFGRKTAADDEKNFSGIPPLSMMETKGEGMVVYSQSGIGTAWDRIPRPFVDVPDPDVSLAMGCNIIAYAMTH